MSQNDGKMEGWLYLIRYNRFGLQYSRKRYFVLQDHHLQSFKSLPIAKNQDPVRSAIIDSCIRVTDNGRETIHRKVFFIFTLYNASNYNDQLKLGATSPNEVARWIQSLQEAALKAELNVGDDVNGLRQDLQPLRLNCPSRVHHAESSDWTSFSPSCANTLTADVITPSPWTIFGCENGLRLFREAKDRESRMKKRDDHPAIMAVGVVDGTSEAIFQTLMSLGSSRSEWDFCFYKGYVVEHLDGHTDIVHKLLCGNWLPWGMKRRDLLFRRYWRRDDDGTYVILYHSVFHKMCPTEKGFIRASLKSGGYVISPINRGRQSVVKHMLAIDWKLWKSYVQTSSARSLTIHMLGRIAALRELFRARLGDHPFATPLREMVKDCELSQHAKCSTTEAQRKDSMITKEYMEEVVKTPSDCGSLLGLSDASDEFFDISEPLDYDPLEDGWLTDPEACAQDIHLPKLSTAADFVKKLHELAVQKRGYTDLQEIAEDAIICNYGSTLRKDPTCNLPCSWTSADPSAFLIRGQTYLDDHKKVKAKGTLMQLVAADWLRSDKREDDLGTRAGSIVQKFAANGGTEFFFIVNLQIPGSTTYSLALYYMTSTLIEDSPLLQSFIKEGDAYRNSRFKLIPHISKGSWIVKQSVGQKACLVGQALKINYFEGNNYLELGIDVGSSTVARGVASLVLGYLNNLVIEMAFLIQGNTADELPEYLLGTCRLNYLDASKSAMVDEMSSTREDFAHDLK